MLYKLHSCVDQTTFSAIRNMYDSMASCVSNQGLTSNCFPILQGTRQGGKSSPYIYLVYIDGLIKELEKSGHGLSLYCLNMSCPTVADDMVLISLSRNGLQQMLNLCHVYACKWRFEYNPLKCGVIVFNEMSTKQVDFSQWNIGSAQICEVDDYTYLGITCNKFMDNSMCIQEAAERLTNQYF